VPASLIIFTVVASLAFIASVAIAVYGVRLRRSNQRWHAAWEDLVRSQPELDRELDEAGRRMMGW
jgi:hypothetical protein